MSVRTAVYDLIRNDPGLDLLLARHKLDATRPAIYESWAVEGTEAPYINVIFFHPEGNHFAKVDGSLTCHIFDTRTTVEAEAVKRALVLALDRETLSTDDDTGIRIYYNSETLLEEPDLIHYEVVFSLKFWRQDLIRKLKG